MPHDTAALAARRPASLETSTASIALLEAMAHMFKKRGSEKFAPMRNIEGAQDLNALTTNGTVYEPIVQELQRHGIDVEPNLGSAVKALKITRQQAHQMGCFCLSPNGIVTGFQVADRIHKVIKAKRKAAALVA